MKNWKWWRFQVLQSSLIISTPWFAIVWSEYEKSIWRYGYWRGLEIWWRPNREAKEGDFVFICMKEFETDWLGYVNQLKSLPTNLLQSKV